MDRTAAPARRTMYLHVGAPKTGTTFLQRILWNHREPLAHAGVVYPLCQELEHFTATMDLRQMEWGGWHDPAWDGSWDRIAQRVNTCSTANAVLSDELLGAATSAQVSRAVASFAPADVHVIFTARDIARQLPSDWQEQIKHSHTVTFDQFVDDVIANGIHAAPPFGEMFWTLHDPVAVLRRWSGVVGADRVHVVTVPQRGAPAATLWQRFASVIGVDASSYSTDVDSLNPSLGSVESEFLRRLNARGDLARRLGPRYDALVRLDLARGVLASRPDRSSIPLPTRHHDWATRRAEQTITDIIDAGWNVIGDLRELRPDFSLPDSPQACPMRADSAELLDVALDAVTATLEQVAEANDRATEAERRLNAMQAAPPVRRQVAAPPDLSGLMRRVRRATRAAAGSERTL